MQTSRFTFAGIAFFGIFSGVFADELEQVVVESEEISQKHLKTELHQIDKHFIANERDIERQHVGITVTEGGRSTSNGFALRGVDSDRVSVKVDGMEAAQSFSPHFYNIKGFINGSRNSVEFENLKAITINKGSNSLLSGNGAIGGSVLMQTKTAEDFIAFHRPIGGVLKTGFDSRNNEFKSVAGIGFMVNGFEGLIQYTQRKGHETKSYTRLSADPDVCGTLATIDLSNNNPDHPYYSVCGRSRIATDPLDFIHTSWLAKLGYRFKEHFINAFYERRDQQNSINEKSHYLQGNKLMTKAITPYQRYGIEYHYVPIDHDFLSDLHVQLARQQVSQIYQGTKYWGPFAPNYEGGTEVWETQDIQFLQKRTQGDLTLRSKELNIWNSQHIVTMTMGAYISQFYSHNRDMEFPHSSYPKPIQKRTSLFVKPVEEKGGYWALGNQIWLNEHWAIHLGIRYDHNKVTEKENHQCYWEISHRPNCGIQSLSSRENKRYGVFSYEAKVDYMINDHLTLGYQFSTGFRMPKVEELYFKKTGLTEYIPNPTLKPEKAKNHEVYVEASNEVGKVSINAFYTQYRDFIDIEHEISTEKFKPFFAPERYRVNHFFLRSSNIERATLTGLEIGAQLNGEAIGLPREILGTFKATWQQGKKNDGTSLLAIQPLTAVVGVGYESNRLRVLWTTKWVEHKKPQTALEKPFPTIAGKWLGNDPQGIPGIYLDENTGKIFDTRVPKSHRFLSQSYFVSDLVASVNITPHIIVNMGVFNLFNRQYSTWDALRQIKQNGQVGDVWDNGAGLERYTAPGRNYGISFEAKF